VEREADFRGGVFFGLNIFPKRGISGLKKERPKLPSPRVRKSQTLGFMPLFSNHENILYFVAINNPGNNPENAVVILSRMVKEGITEGLSILVTAPPCQYSHVISSVLRPCTQHPTQLPQPLLTSFPYSPHLTDDICKAKILGD
jgi:hypothetical protein